MNTLSCEAVAEQVGLLFSCSQVNQFIRIRTPFLYPDGDIIDIFAQESEDRVILTDLGETLRWLKMQTVTMKRSKKQNTMIADVCMNHNVELYRGMLLVRIKEINDLGLQVMRIAQAALRVSDLWFTFRNQSFESIADEVQEYLLENRIRHDRNYKVIGRSTRPWTVDFYTLHPNRSSYITVLSTSNSSVAQTLTNGAIARWTDLASYQATSNIRFISLFDDTTDVWRDYNFRQLENISEVVYWSRPENLLEQITS